MKTCLSALALAAALGTGPAAALTVYSDSVLFQNAAPGTTYEDFEDSTFDGTTIDFGGGTITCAGGNYCGSFFGNSLGVAGTAISGTKAPFFGTPDVLTFTFAAPITAFGIFIGGAGDVGVQNLTATLSDGTLFDVLTNYTNGSDTFIRNTVFFGFTGAAPVTSISFTGTDDNDGVFFDDMSYGVAAIPLPAGALLLGTALMGLGATAGRRRGA